MFFRFSIYHNFQLKKIKIELDVKGFALKEQPES